MKKFIDERTWQNNNEIEWGKARDNLLEEIPASYVADSPFIYMDRRGFAQSIAKIKIFEMVKNVQGSIVECGVHRGNSLMLFSHLCSVFNPVGFNRKVIGFDTFTGFTGLSEIDPSEIKIGDMSDVNYNHLKTWTDFQQKNNIIPHINRVEIIKGDALITIKEYFKNNSHSLVSLLYLDFDLYKPTLCALENIVPNMPSGAIIAFDQLNQKKWSGETAAIKEFFKLNDLKLRVFDFEPHISYVII